MARRIKVDSEKLVKMVQDGTIEKEVLEKFGLKSDSRFTVVRADALNQTEQRLKNPKTPAGSFTVGKTVRVSKRGSIAISRKLVEALGLQMGDSFQVKRSKNGIALKKLEPK